MLLGKDCFLVVVGAVETADQGIDLWMRKYNGTGALLNTRAWLLKTLP